MRRPGATPAEHDQQGHRRSAKHVGPVTAVVVSYNSGADLTAFLDSIGSASAQPVEVVVADNGSTDGAPERAAQRPDVTLLPTGGNLGYGGAANLGVARTGSDWILIANPDVVLAPGSIDALLAAAARWPRAGAIGPLIRTPDGAVYPSARLLPSLSRGIGHALFGWFWPGNPWTVAYRQDRSAPVERRAGWLSGSCLLVRRSAFASVGGFDESYFMYFEDVDLGERLGRAGWLNIYAPSAEVRHAGGHSTAQHANQMLVEHHRSAYRYLAGRYSDRRYLPVRLGLRAGLTVRARLAPRLAAWADRWHRVPTPPSTATPESKDAV